MLVHRKREDPSKRAAASQAHDRLLRIVWDQLDELATALYLISGREAAAKAEAEAEDYPEELRSAGCYVGLFYITSPRPAARLCRIITFQCVT